MEWCGARAGFLDSKIDDKLYSSELLVYLSGKSNFRHFRWILVDFSRIFIKSLQNPTRSFLENDPGKYGVFFFPQSFRCFQQNKSVLETTETKQANSQLHFATKIIKIQLLVFENKLFENPMCAPKKSQK